MVSVGALLVAAATLGSTADINDLVVGQARPGQMRADEVHAYRVTLDAGQAYLLELEQAGLDFIVSLQAPHGVQVSYNSPFLRLESERILVEPTQAGEHLIRLRSNEYTGGLGHYILTISRLAGGSQQTELRRDALHSETQAAKSYFVGGNAAWAEVVSAYRKAAECWHELDDRPAAARASLALAHVLHHELTDWQGSIQEADRAADLYRASGNDSLFASALHLKAASVIEEATQLGKNPASSSAASDSESLFAEALRISLEAMNIKARRDEHYERARIINHIGISKYYQGDLDAARLHFVHAAAVFRDAREWSEELNSTLNLSVVEMDQGHLAEAITSLARVIALATPDRLPKLRGYALDNISSAYRGLGDIDNALASSLEALRLHEARGELKAQGQSLGDIGMAYFLAGDLERAREHLEAALVVRRQARDGLGQAAILRVLGSIYREQQDLESAISAHREAASVGGPAYIAQAEILLARDLAEVGQVNEALAVLDAVTVEAIAADRALMVAAALLERGAVRRRSGQALESEADLRQALSMYREMALSRHEARAAFELALLKRENGRLEVAADYALHAINLVERHRGMITNPDMRATFLGLRQDYYHFYIDLQAEQFKDLDDLRYLHAALDMSERARARAFVDLLNDSSVKIPAASDPELRARESRLHTEFAELRFQHDRLIGTGVTTPEVDALLKKLRRTESELDGLDTELRRGSSDRSGLRSPVIQDLRAIQANLDPDSVLVQYALGEPRSYAFIVTDSSASIAVLAPGAEIAALARQAHERLRLLDSGRPKADRDSPLRQLAARVLWPIQDLLDRHRVVVVPDGALHYVPFAVLPLEGSEDDDVPLLVKHEIVNLPSMSVLVAQRQQLGPRVPHRLTVAVFADPVFEIDDPRVSGTPRIAEASSPAATYMFAAWGASALQRLPATGDEAAVIASLVPEDQRLVLTGLDASRDLILGNSLLDYRIIHLATHGLIDTRFPALSGLAFSSIDANGQSLDGVVRLRDIYGLRLNADLVVLSACSTGLGRELRGEGMIGLTRGFQFAGSRTVIASLWQVPDRATAKLMEFMYVGLLQEGKQAAAALREAQLHIATTRRWRDPHYWASLVAYGEWQQAPEMQ